MSDLSEVKSLIERIGTAHEEFKKTNDEMLKAKADGKAVGDLETKLTKISADLDKLGDLREQVSEVEKKLNRPSFETEQDRDIKVEAKSFNDIRRANAPAGANVADLDAPTYANYKSAYFNLLRKGNIAMLSGDEQKALQAGVDSDGGYLLPSATVGRVVKKVYELSPIRQIANVQSISTDAMEGLADTGEASYGWASETGSRSETDSPTVGKYRIEAHEMYAAPRATQKLIDDSAVDIESWLAAKVADKFARVEGAAFITGTGVGQPRGFASYTTAATADSSRSWGEIEHVASGASGDFAATTPADYLHDLIGKFKTAYLQNAKWVTRREVITKVRKFKGSDNNYLWQPSLQAGQPDTLLGYAIVNAQDVATLAADSLSLWFGDFMEGYQIVDRIGIRTLRDPFTAKPYVVFYSTKRVGGGVVNFEAIKAMKFNT